MNAVLLVFLLIYPVAMIGVGITYLNDCPIQNWVPVWLVVMGSCTCFIEFLLSLFITYTFIRFSQRKSLRERLLVNILLILPLALTVLFSIGWFFTGNAWVYSIYRQVQYTDPKNLNGTYCNQQCYLFSFWTINVIYIILAFVIIIGNGFFCYCFFKKE